MYKVACVKYLRRGCKDFNNKHCIREKNNKEIGIKCWITTNYIMRSGNYPEPGFDGKDILSNVFKVKK